MEFLADPVILARIQFAFTACTHYLMVPLSIGLGLILLIHEVKYYKSGKPEDLAGQKLWLKLFTTCFVLGVATGITMEFSFGTNWAYYSRFVGDIFGAPLAAEALLAFFLESTFLGVLLFGRGRVSEEFYLVSTVLVWFASCLSALWILIANSWMQTPAGAELSADGSRAVITGFFEAAFNPSTINRYTHTVDALLIMGAFVALSVGAYYLIKKRNEEFGIQNLRIGATVGIVCTALMLVFAHSTAVGVANDQPTKFAMMEGSYISETMPLYLFGWVDTATQQVVGVGIDGGTSWLASGDFNKVYPGLNELASSSKYSDMDVSQLPVQIVFQSYHLMVAMYGVMLLVLLVTLAMTFMNNGERIRKATWLQKILLISPAFPMIAIQLGWFTAEFGRQPWIVYPSTTGPDGVELLVQNAASTVSAPELLITIALFVVVYAFLLVAFFRIFTSQVKEGPIVREPATEGGDEA